MRLSDISCPFPRDQSSLVKLCELAIIMEGGAKAIYGTRSASLRQLYTAAEKTYEQLQNFAKQNGIGAVSFEQTRDDFLPMELLALHNCKLAFLRSTESVVVPGDLFTNTSFCRLFSCRPAYVPAFPHSRLHPPAEQVPLALERDVAKTSM